MITPHQKKQIQGLLQDPRWEIIESIISDYMKENFIQNSVKRDSEFNTIWDMAFTEGGKYHIQRFFNSLEANAHD